jgi:hypothetical protein
MDLMMRLGEAACYIGIGLWIMNRLIFRPIDWLENKWNESKQDAGLKGLNEELAGIRALPEDDPILKQSKQDLIAAMERYIKDFKGLTQQQCIERLGEINRLAGKYDGRAECLAS